MNRKIIFTLCTIILFVLINMFNIISYYYNYSGEKLYNDSEYDSAITAFSKGLNVDRFYNIANVYYKKKDYEKAISSYLLTQESNNKDLNAKANHNIGNSMYRLGKQNESEKLDYYLTAVEYYNKSLGFKYDEETQQNRDFVLNLIKELEQNDTQENSNSEDNNKENQNSSGEENNEEESENENSESNGNESESNSENGEESLSEAQKQELERIGEAIKESQSDYNEALNKVYRESYDPFDSFFSNDDIFEIFEDDFFGNTSGGDERDW